MKALLVALALSAFALGCGKKDKGAAVVEPTCDAVVPKVMTLMGPDILGRELSKEKRESWTGKLTQAFMASCKDDRWPDAVMKCVAEARTAGQVDACGDKAENDQFAKQMEARLKPFEEELRNDKLAAAGKPIPPSLTPPTPAPSGIAACDALAAAFDKYAACDKIPQSDRDAQKLALEDMRKSWTGLADDEAKSKAAAACEAATQPMIETAAKMGCAP